MRLYLWNKGYGNSSYDKSMDNDIIIAFCEVPAWFLSMLIDWCVGKETNSMRASRAVIS